MARLLAALAVALSCSAPVHATYPGENGVIVFDTDTNPPSIGKVLPPGGVVTNLAVGSMPKVSPNGKKIAFLRGAHFDLKDIYVMNIDGSNVVKLTEAPVSTAVAWWPDGSRLAYTVAASRMGVADLWTMRPDGSGKTRIRTLTKELNGIDWSPSSDAFTFEGGGLIWVADTVNPIPPARWQGFMPTWAPDGAKLIFGGNNGYVSLAEMNPDGTDHRYLPPNNVFAGTNAVSPDGTLIAGGVASNMGELGVRARVGLPFTYSTATTVQNVDWGRVPKNCHATTPQGGGGVLGGDVDFYADQCVIAVMPNPAASGGVLAQALAVGPDSRVYARSLRVNPLNGVPVWGPFTVIPGLSGNTNGVNAKKLAAAAGNDGSLQVVIVIASDNTVAHAIQYPNGSWSGFSRLDGFQGAPGFQARDVAIAINGSTPASQGNAQVIANGLVGGSIFHRVRWPAGNWSPFMQVPGAETMNTQALAIASSDDLYTNVLTITTAGAIKQVLRDPAGNWSGWVNMVTPQGMQFSNDSDVAITRADLGSGSSVAYVMFVDATRQAYLQVRNDPNLAASWQVQMPAEPVTTDARTVSLSWGGFQTPMVITRAYPQ